MSRVDPDLQAEHDRERAQEAREARSRHVAILILAALYAAAMALLVWRWA